MRQSRPGYIFFFSILLFSLFLVPSMSAEATENSIGYRWIPEELVTTMQVQAAYSDGEIFMLFRWSTEEPSFYHDYLVYQDGEWVRRGASPVGPDPYGFYEDRLSVMVDDGSVKGFANFGGWLVSHEGMRFLDSEVSPEEVQAHPYLGEVLGASDVRHYLPHTRQGEWWEGDWDAVLPVEELENLWEEGVFVDLWQWRAHRSNPVGYWDDGYVFDFRHGDSGTSTFYSQSWDPVEGPRYMFDPEKVGFAALAFEKLVNREYGQDDKYYLHEEFIAPYDAEHMFEGAVIPRIILREPEGSRGAIKGQGRWEDGYWTVETRRVLDTGYPDDKAFEEGQTYTFAFAVHKRATGSRWHYTSYPYKLGIGADADITAVKIETEVPEWNNIPAEEITLIYPGQVTWTFLVSEDHPFNWIVRDDGSSLWDCHPNPVSLSELAVRLEQR